MQQWFIQQKMQKMQQKANKVFPLRQSTRWRLLPAGEMRRYKLVTMR